LSIEAIGKGLESYQYRARSNADADKWAGVAALLRPADTGTEVLLIQRSDQPGDPWSGHMALPGGRAIDEDPSIRHTAERETFEEVGIDLANVGQYLGRLDDIAAVGRGKRINLTIAPHVFATPANVETVANPREVQNILWIPLRELAAKTHRSEMTYEYDGMSLRLPCWRWQEHVVWGLTYNILEMMLRIGI